MHDVELYEILDFMELSRKGYRRVRRGVRKRLVRRILELGLRSSKEYLRLLADSPEEYEKCRLLCGVTIGRFFRDKSLWKAFEAMLAQDVSVRKMTTMRVWCAGCGRGEEVYTIKFIWDFRLAKGCNCPPLRILATDFSMDNLAAAKLGVYGVGSMKELPNDVGSELFEGGLSGRKMKVKGRFKQGIGWMLHDLYGDVPEYGFHVLFLRNSILTYCVEPVRTVLFERITSALSDGGILVLGSHERVPDSSKGFVRQEAHPCIYRKTGA